MRRDENTVWVVPSLIMRVTASVLGVPVAFVGVSSENPTKLVAEKMLVIYLCTGIFLFRFALVVIALNV